MKLLGQRLTRERKRSGLSQAAIAKAGGVRVNAQIHYESGKRTPDANYLASIAEAGIDVNYVVTGHRTDGPHFYTVQKIRNELHNRLWTTAQAIAELAQLQNPSDTRTPREHLAAYVKFLYRNN